VVTFLFIAYFIYYFFLVSDVAASASVIYYLIQCIFAIPTFLFLFFVVFFCGDIFASITSTVMSTDVAIKCVLSF